MTAFTVTYIGSKHEQLPDPQPVQVEAPNIREAIRKVGPIRDGCVFDVEDSDGDKARFRVRLQLALEPLDLPQQTPQAA